MALPQIILENQFGEISNNFIKGGSNQIRGRFTVDVANVNGLGLSGLVGSQLKNVFMHSTAAFTGTSHTSTLIDSISSTANLVVGMPVQGSGIPAGTTIASIVSSTSITLSAATSSSTTGSITYQGVGSPNPAAGYIVVKMGSNYASFLSSDFMLQSPLSGSDVNISSGLTANGIYVISAVGTSTAANWQAIGLPVGITPAIGVAFVASTSSAGTGTGKVQILKSSASGIDHIELAGDPNVSCNPSDKSGAQIILACFAKAAGALTMNSYTPAGVITNGTPDTFAGTPAVLTGSSAASTDVLAAPADGTVIGLRFSMGELAQPLI